MDDFYIESRQTLGLYDLQAIRRLALECNSFEELNLRLNWGMLEARSAGSANDFMCLDGNGKLEGYLGMYGFGGHQIEISGMVHPECRRKGVFKSLFENAARECRTRGIDEVLFICERKSLSGYEFIRSLGAALSHSEYRMELDAPPEAQGAAGCSPDRLVLREADKSDFLQLAYKDSLCFDMPVEETLKFYESSARNTRDTIYTALLDNQIMGSVTLHDDGSFVFLFGFGISPEYRGKGFGKAIFKKALDIAAAKRHGRVALEVDCSNSVAFSLYKSCGFRVVTTYDYYSLKI